MPSLLQLTLGAAAALGIAAMAMLGRRVAKAWLVHRGTHVVNCPETMARTSVRVDARRAALSAARGRVRLRLEACTHWPERRGCGQGCLQAIEAAPEACLLQNLLGEWYEGRACAFCGQPLAAVRWHDHRPALLSPGGALVDWSGFRPEQVVDVLATHRPVCWNCHVAEGFRRDHPDRVTDRGQPSSA